MRVKFILTLIVVLMFFGALGVTGTTQKRVAALNERVRNLEGIVSAQSTELTQMSLELANLKYKD